MKAAPVAQRGKMLATKVLYILYQRAKVWFV
jgi:hypothetical protein